MSIMPRRYRKKRNRKKRKSKIPRMFPSDTQIVKLRYADSIQLDAGVGTPNAYVFRANSLFDPDYTGVGHQPLGYDEWGAFYQKYCVLGSRITVIVNTDSNSVGVNQLVSVKCSDTVGLHDYPQTAIEDPNTATRVLNGVYNGKSGLITLRKNYSCKNHFNLVDPMDSEQNVNHGSNPADPVFFVVTAWDLDGVDPPNLHCTVIIDYIAKFSEPTRLLRS